MMDSKRSRAIMVLTVPEGSSAVACGAAYRNHSREKKYPDICLPGVYIGFAWFELYSRVSF